MTPSEAAAIITAVGGTLAIFLKMWVDHSKLATKVADAFERSATVGTELKDAVAANTEMTKAAKVSSDEFTRILMQVVDTKKYKKRR